MSIRNKILGAFIVVIAIAVAVMAFTSRIYINRMFDRYAESYRTVVAEQWEYVFKLYYLRNGSWDGVEQLLSQRVRGRSPMSLTHPGQARGGTLGILPGEGLLLADVGGRIVLDSNREMTGETLSRDFLALGTDLYLENEHIGTLILQPHSAQAVLTLEEQFSRSIISAVFLGGGIALLVGAVLSFLLTGQITRPLAQLTSSARRFARREFQHRLQLNRKDEVGNLAEAFNTMAESIEKNETLRRNLMADVSHELRTPITILRGNFEALQSGKAKATLELLSSLYDEVLRLGRLVSDLEAINLAEAGKLPLHCTMNDVGTLLARAAGAFQYEADERRIDLTLQVDPEVNTWVVDEDRIVQVLINLLANAFKFTPDGGTIILGARREKSRLIVEVADSGPGIPPEDLPFVFERFYKAGPGRGSGSGLGLSIAKSFVEAHGGTISAANGAEGGSIFTFSLPRGTSER